MPTKPIDRLLFVQGGECFFCKQVLAKADASLEHLVAQVHGGKNHDENLVVCCKTLNNLFGRMSLKEKLEVILKQRGGFQCPAQTAFASTAPSKTTVAKHIVPHPKPGTPLALLVENLRKRGNSRPTNLDKLSNTIRTFLGQQNMDVSMAAKLVDQLRSHKWISVEAGVVSYSLPALATSQTSDAPK